MMRRVLQPLWFLLALIFLIEAWLWDHLEPVVARVVARFRCALSRHGWPRGSRGYRPCLTLLVFIAPLILLLVR